MGSGIYRLIRYLGSKSIPRFFVEKLALRGAGFEVYADKNLLCRCSGWWFGKWERGEGRGRGKGMERSGRVEGARGEIR